MLRPASNRQIASSRQRHQLERILETLPGLHISRNNSQAFYFKFRRIERKKNRERVINARIGIDDDSLRSLRNCNRREEDDNQQNANQNSNVSRHDRSL